MDIETAVAALQALLEEAFQQLTAKVADSRLRIRVDDKRVRNFNSSCHFLFNPKRTTGADGWSAVLLNTWTRAAA